MDRAFISSKKRETFSAFASLNSVQLILTRKPLSLANLIAAFPGQSWQGAAAVATHPRIAQAARDAGFGRVALAGAGLDALCASIESLG